MSTTFKGSAIPKGKKCLSKFNLCNLSNNEKNRMELEKRAAYLIHKKKLGRMPRQQIKDELMEIENDIDREHFRCSLNKYNRIKKIGYPKWLREKQTRK